MEPDDGLPLTPEADDQKLLAQIVDFYHQTLKNSTVGVEYLKKRGITNPDVIDHFRIGLSNRTLGPSLPTKESKAGRNIRSRLERLGIYRSTGHEHLNGCIVFPIPSADGTGRIVDIYGRKITGKRLRKGTPLHMHLNDQRLGVWNVEAFGPTDEVILCTSLFDALTFWNFGYRHVSCVFGNTVTSLTEDFLQACTEFRIRRVLTPCEAFAPPLMEAGMDCFLLRFPIGLDVNAYALQVDDPAECLGAIIRKAEWIGNGKGNENQPTIEMKESHTDAKAEPCTTEVTLEHPPAQSLGIVEPTEIVPMDSPQKDQEETAIHDDPIDDEDAEPLAFATPMPPAPEDVEAELGRDEVTITLGHRRYRVRGFSKNLSFDQMKVNVLVFTDRGMFVDTFDLYSARHRKAYIQQAALELSLEEKTIKKDLGRVLLKLEEIQDEQIKAVLEPEPAIHQMSEEERTEALRFLRDPDLIDRIVGDFQVVGETTNKLMGYLAAVSRKLDQPLAVIVQSSSAAGKTSLMEAILSFVPIEDQVKYSAMTGQSLFYMGETNLKHKILAIVEEEGAERASYALKLLQSEGELMIASTGKEVSTGRLVTEEYRVQGPVMIFLTTTSVSIDEELLNRCIVLSVDEDREQTRAIHRIQRHQQTLEGLLSRKSHQQTITLHRNAQRLLKPLLVANPFAEELTFMDHQTRSRRDHLKYLTLIRSITLLRQHQRPTKQTEHDGKPIEYIEVTLEDIELANKLASEVLGRSTEDLPAQTQRLLSLIVEMVTKECDRQGVDQSDFRFTRRDVRQHTGWGNTQLKVHLKRLVDLEHLLVHRGGRGNSFAYELLYGPQAEPGAKQLAGLIDVDQLRRNRSGSNGKRSDNSRGLVSTESASSRAVVDDVSADEEIPNSSSEADAPK